MSIYHNYKATKQIGNNLAELREAQGFEIEDIADMTGFPSNTIRNIESGKEATISYLIAIALALKVHPKEVLNIDIKIEPLYKLSIKRSEKTRLTKRIDGLVSSNYFVVPRSASDVCSLLEDEYGAKTTSASVSVILIRLKNQGKLKVKKQGRFNLYYIK